MPAAPRPANEAERLRNLERYDIMDSASEQAYDDITHLASQICGTPVSLITLIGEDRQWFKSSLGVPEGLDHTPRDIAFCAYNILEPDQPMVVSNMLMDERFKDNPLVQGEHHVMFYAGAPLVTSKGHALGSLCVIDREPREITTEQVEALQRLSRQVVHLMELRRSLRSTEANQAATQKLYRNLYTFTHTISHDLKAPLRNIRQFLEIIQEDYGEHLPAEGKEMMGMTIELAEDSRRMIDGVIAYSDAVNDARNEVEPVDLPELVDQLKVRIGLPEGCSMKFAGPVDKVRTAPVALKHILQNLITNSVDCRDKEETLVTIRCERVNEVHKFSVEDNGRGISEQDIKAVFTLFYSLDKERNSHGVGLSIVTRLVEMLGGEVGVESTLGEGSNFWFTVPAA